MSEVEAGASELDAGASVAADESSPLAVFEGISLLAAPDEVAASFGPSASLMLAEPGMDFKGISSQELMMILVTCNIKCFSRDSSELRYGTTRVVDIRLPLLNSGAPD